MLCPAACASQWACIRPLICISAGMHGQASQRELHGALSQRGACDSSGRWQVLAEKFVALLLHLLLLTAQHQGWLLSHIPGAEAVSLLQQDGYDARQATPA